MGHDLVWTLRDKETFERSVALCFSDDQRLAQSVIKRFYSEIQLHPFEWPTSDRPPSEHVVRHGGVAIRYRVVPSTQQVEVLSVTPRGKKEDEAKLKTRRTT